MSDPITKNFSRSEFRCKCGCADDNISLELVKKLQEVRDLCGFSLVVTSGVRCAAHNAKEGGVSDSSHVPRNGNPGFAADIRCENASKRYTLLSLFLSRFSRVGIGKNYIHVDVDPDKPQEVVWHYYR